MKTKILLPLIVIATIAYMLGGCQQKKEIEVAPELKLDQISQTLLKTIRLGDGVPLDVQIAIRWKIDDYENFISQFAKPNRYDSLILTPRGREIVSRVANLYTSVDSVFTTKREAFMKQVRDSLQYKLGEPGVAIKEVILSDIIFPKSFTDAMEKMGMKEKELQLIRQQSIIDKEAAIAAETRAESNGKVQIAQAKMDGEVAKINARTEEQRRLSTLAKAETDAQVKELQTKARKREAELMAEADLKKRTDLKNLEIERKREIDLAEIDKKQKLDLMDFEHQQVLAGLYSKNPTYASFLVNKDLAKQVEIAILPAKMDGTVFSDLINNKIK